MSDVAAVAKHAIKTEARRRSPFASAIPVTALVLVDVVLTLAAFALSYKLRQHSDIFIWRPRKSLWPIGVANDFEPYLGFLFFAPIVKTYMLRRYGLYRLRGEFSFGNDVAKIISASTLASLVLVLIAFSFRQGFAYREGHLVWLDFSYSRLVFVYDWLLAIAGFWIVRSVVRVIQILYRAAERNLIPTVVVGCGEMAEVCISEISKKRRLGYKLVGAVKARVNEDSSSLASYDVRMLGGFDDLPDLVKRYGVEEVLITDSRINPRKMFEVLMECGRDHHIKYRVIPNLFDCLPGKTEIATIGSLPMIKLYEEGLRGSQKALKRGMDFIVAIGLLLVSWPFWLALAIRIKMESSGPVLLRQERVGMDGNVFSMFKFRSMIDGVDDQAHRELMQRTINGEDANQGTADQPIYGKLKDDPRLTKIRSWMRRYSVDELPQVLN